MSKFIYNYDETKLIINKLLSGKNSIIKDTAQKLAEESSNGRMILKSMQSQVIYVLNSLMNTPQHKPIYKWIYKCVCYYSDDESERILKHNFLYEKDSECRVWIISAISSRYKDEKLFMYVINELKERTGASELQGNKLFYATSLFSKLPIKRLSYNYTTDILDNNDAEGMIWLAKLYAFPMQAKRRGLDNLVKEDTVESMSYSENKQVQLYTYWSMINHKSFHLLGIDDIAKKKINSDVLKWYFYGMIEGQFIQKNFDYINDVIFLCIYNFNKNLRIKQGVMNALLNLPYECYFDNAIIQWFYNDEDVDIQIAIIEYFVKNVKHNCTSENVKYGAFYEIIKDEYENYGLKTYICSYAKIYKTLTIENNKFDIIEKEFEEKGQKGGGDSMFYGGQTFISSANITNSQIGGQNNQQSIQQSQDKELIELLEQFIKVCSDKQICEECAEIKKTFSFPDFKDKINKLVANIASWLTIASATPMVYETANRLINYIIRNY